MKLSRFFGSPAAVFSSAILLRVVLLVYGHYQDQWSPLKYTDIDYYVFTDAARYLSRGQSPYRRDTYRYTPLLAWLLWPTSKGGLLFDFGKAVFAASDVVAGVLIYAILRSSRLTYRMPVDRALKFASIWLLNPMVAQISTRGSSEGLLAVLVVALLYAALQRQYALAGMLLGLAVHLKIYPFIYGVAILFALKGDKPMLTMFSRDGLLFIVSSVTTFIGLNAIMFQMYGIEFVHHTYIYHLIRSDHRHNFSIYNMLLYAGSSSGQTSKSSPEALAFLPQLSLAALLIPWRLSKHDLATTMMLQTFCFVTFNKVCTSQYFLWYMVFLPFYLPDSSLLRNTRLGLTALGLWIGGQAIWLQQGFQLEFLGRSTFLPGLFGSSMVFYAVNTWIIGIAIQDVLQKARSTSIQDSKKMR